MDQQKIVNTTRSYAATLAAGEVRSVRIKEDKKTVVRVYDGGKIGIAGCIGDGDEAALAAQAGEMLAQNVTYPDALGNGERRSVDLVAEIIPEADFLKRIERLAARLKERFPQFRFSDKIILEQMASHYTDSNGTDLSYADKTLLLGLMIKAVDSANIMDLDYSADNRYYDEDAVLGDMAKMLDVYYNKLALPAEKLPVIINTSAINYMLSHLLAETYASGASLFSGKLGQKLFDEKVNLRFDRTPGKHCGTAFFDSEGVTLPDDKFYFIRAGKLEGLATYRRSAAMLDLPLSGCGYAEFDEVPQCGYFSGIELAAGENKLSDVFKGKGIYVTVTSGGDMTPDGRIAMPVMLAYLYDNGALVGTLPEFGISASLYDILGKDLIAIAQNDMFSYQKEDVLVAWFDIDKK